MVLIGHQICELVPENQSSVLWGGTVDDLLIGNSHWDVSIYDKKDDSSDKCSSDPTRVYGHAFARMGFVGWLWPVFHERSKGGTEMRVSHPTRHVLSTAMRPARLFRHVAAGEQPSRTPQP